MMITDIDITDAHSVAKMADYLDFNSGEAVMVAAGHAYVVTRTGMLPDVTLDDDGSAIILESYDRWDLVKDYEPCHTGIDLLAAAAVTLAPCVENPRTFAVTLVTDDEGESVGWAFVARPASAEEVAVACTGPKHTLGESEGTCAACLAWNDAPVS